MTTNSATAHIMLALSAADRSSADLPRSAPPQAAGLVRPLAEEFAGDVLIIAWAVIAQAHRDARHSLMARAWLRFVTGRQL